MKKYGDITNYMFKSYCFRCVIYIILILLSFYFIIFSNSIINIFGLIFLIFFLSRLIKTLVLYNKFKKSITPEIIQKIQNELNDIVFDGGEYILTNNYIIDNKNFHFIEYKDILLITKKTHFVLSGLSDTFKTRVYVVTKYCRCAFTIADLLNVTIGNCYENNLYNFLKEKNSNVLDGDNFENKKILEKSFGIKLTLFWKAKVRFSNIYN